jgi:hypothetical protein
LESRSNTACCISADGEDGGLAIFNRYLLATMQWIKCGPISRQAFFGNAEEATNIRLIDPVRVLGHLLEKQPQSSSGNESYDCSGLTQSMMLRERAIIFQHRIRCVCGTFSPLLRSAQRPNTVRVWHFFTRHSVRVAASPTLPLRSKKYLALKDLTPWTPSVWLS